MFLTRIAPQIGQALRICVIEGWHRPMPSLDIDSFYTKRCTTIFWTAYIIDREFGTLIGAPSSIRDLDITVRVPSPMGASFEQPEAFALQVQIARLTANILSGKMKVPL